MAGGKGGGQGGRGNKPGSHRKGAAAGSGGKGRRGLAGRGPTPAARDRTGHPAARASKAAARKAGFAKPVGSGGAAGRGRKPAPGKGSRTQSEIVAGRNAVVEALRAGVPASTLYVAERIDADERVREALKSAADRGVPLLEAPRPELDRISGGAIHQGLLLAVPPYDYAHPDDLPHAAQAGDAPLLVALDGVTDPRNLGAVVRSAAAFGAHGVLVPERRAAGMTAGAWKSSAGAAARLPVARATNLTRALESYQRAGLLVVGLSAHAGLDLADLEAATEPLVVVVGAEDRGLSRLVGQVCDLTVRIPIAAATESLNAGVAAGIVLYEIARRRAAPS